MPELQPVSATLDHAVPPPNLPSTYSTVYILSALPLCLTEVSVLLSVSHHCFSQTETVLTNACWHIISVSLKSIFYTSNLSVIGVYIGCK